MSELVISLLGPPEIMLDGQTLTFESGKAVALLAYLAVMGSDHPRAELATLLWPESTSARARGALRYTLSLLRKSQLAEWLIIERQAVGLVRNQPIQVDVSQFQQGLNQSQRHNHPDDELCPDCLIALTEAAQYYRDDFMTGFTLRDSPTFDEWQFFQTENLRRDATLVLAKLTGYYFYQENYQTALNYGRRWYQFDPLHEPAHRQLIKVYAALGQRAAAHRQYDHCVQMLSDEFGIGPSPETEQVYRQIQQMVPEQDATPKAAVSRSPIIASPLDNLPLQPTPCIGREAELTELDDLLKDENIRLLTILGVGGIGKTRLALEVAARQRGRFDEGIFFVPLASLKQGEGLVSAIAELFGLTFAAGHPPLAQLQDFLKNREILLLLDNIEHLLIDVVSLTTALLQAAPLLKIVTTSRVRLQMQWEYCYPLQGLDTPAEPIFEGLIPHEEASTDLNQSPAVTLFQQRSQQINQANDLSVLTDMARICRLTEGMPLAIELAAAMTHVLSLPAIAAEIARNYRVLQSTWHDVDARHHSIQAVFDSTWHTLTPTEQTIFARLAVFRGGFTQKAAVKITQATLSTLTSLVNKSLLSRRSAGRFEIHELMRQYAADKLANLPADKERVQRQHRDYYGAFLNQQVTDWESHYRQENLAAIHGEIDNLREAWQHTLSLKDSATLSTFTEQLYIFHNARGRYTEAAEMIRQALSLLQTQTNSLPDLPQAKLTYLLGKAYWGMGQMAQGQQHLEQALGLNGTPLPKRGWPMLGSFSQAMLVQLKRHLPLTARKNPNAAKDQVSLLAAQIYDTLSQMGHTKNDQVLAGFAVVRGLAYAEMAGASLILAVGYANMSTLFSGIGRYRFAAYYATMANQVLPQANVLPAQAAVSMRLKVYYSSLGRWERATAEGKRALRGFQQLGDRRHWGDCLMSLGLVALLCGSFRESITYAVALQVHAKHHYNNEQYALGMCGQAFALLHLNQGEEATTLLNELGPLLTRDKAITSHCRAVYDTMMAMIHLRAGQPLQAIEAADQAVAILPNKVILNPPMSMFYNHVSDIYFTIWEQAKVDTLLAKQVDMAHVQSQARRVCRDMSRLAWLFPLRSMFDYLRLGQYYWLAGKPGQAKKLWRKSLAQAEKMAVPYVEAVAHFQLGRHLPIEDVDRVRHLRQAKEIFQRLDASYDLAQVMMALNEGGSIDHQRRKNT